MKLVDSHIHLTDFKSDYISEVINDGLTKGVEKFICVSSKYDDFEDVEALYQKYLESIIPCFGFHPWYLKEVNLSKLEEKLSKIPTALIGEIGLDGYKENFEKQIEIFTSQIDLAKRYKRPVIMHGVKAQSFFEKNWDIMPDKFVFHSYSGKKDFLKQIISKGGYVSFSGSILRNKNIKEIYEMVPEDKLLVETDAPFQADGPSNLPEIVFSIAKIVGVDVEELSNRLYKNSLEFVKVG